MPDPWRDSVLRHWIGADRSRKTGIHSPRTMEWSAEMDLHGTRWERGPITSIKGSGEVCGKGEGLMVALPVA